MTYSDNELQQIEKFASIYLPISDIAVILDIPADVLRADVADRTTPVSKAYRRGKAASKVKLHSQEMMLAQVGSPLAIRKSLLPMLATASRDFHRWRYNEMILAMYNMAEKRKGSKTMERAASSYAKYNRVASGSFSAMLRKRFAMTARTRSEKSSPRARKASWSTAPTAPTRFLPFGRSYFVVDTLYIGCEKFPQTFSPSLTVSGVL